MADVVDWDPEALLAFRKKYDLPRTAMIRLLMKHGLTTLSYSAYLKWERTREQNGSQPHAAHRAVIEETLREEGKRLTEAVRRGKPTQV